MDTIKAHLRIAQRVAEGPLSLPETLWAKRYVQDVSHLFGICKWIPVTEREPNWYERVLVVTRDERFPEQLPMGAWRIDVDQIVMSVGWRPFHIVSHWMPLPDMPIMQEKTE